MTDMSINQDSLTLEETNKVRVSLGLKPIGEGPDVGEDGEEVVDQDAAAEENFEKRKAEMRKEKEENELKERIAKARNQRDLKAKLKGSTLGETSKDDSLSAASWIRKQKRRAQQHEKLLAERRAKEMEEADRLASYGEDDLTGLKVNHGAEDFQEGEDVILTLRDSKVLAGEEDELQNVNLVEEQARRAAKERKRKAMEQYTGYDDEEFEEGRVGKKADILGKYDDEFETGKVRSEGFRLGGAAGKVEKIETEEDGGFVSLGGGADPAIKVKLNLDYAKDFEVSDYAREGEAGFKKPKKKKAKRSARRTEGDEDDMQVDGEPTFNRRIVDEGPQNLVDDDDLQAALSRARRENNKKRAKVSKPEDLAKQIAERRLEEGDGGIGQEVGISAGDETGEEDDGRITFDDTSEFVRNVSLEGKVTVKRERRDEPEESTSAANGSGAGKGKARAENGGDEEDALVVKIERVEGDDDMDEDEAMESEDEDEALAEMAAREGMSLEEYRLKIDEQMREIDNIKVEEPTESDPVVGNGMAGVLNLLRQQGSLKVQTAEEKERERIQKQKDLWLADYRRRIAQRELEKIQARGGNKDQAQREWENKMREQQEARDALDIYKTYKPDINIVYHDEFGREMTPKEAWKSLSHKFHGKTSGRMKTEKRLKKIAEERKQLTMGSGDTPTGMSNAFSRRQVKTGEAHMVLSVGNKGSVQMDKKGKKGR